MAKCNEAFVFGVMENHPESYNYAKNMIHELELRRVRNFAVSLPENMQSFLESALMAREKGQPLENVKFSSGDGFEVDASSISGIVGLAAAASERWMSINCVGAPVTMERVQRKKALLDEADLLPPRERVDRIAEINSEDYKHEANRISQMPGKAILLTGVLNVGGKGATAERLRKMGIDATGVVISPESGRSALGDDETIRMMEAVRSQSPQPTAVVVSGEAGSVSPEKLASQLNGWIGEAESVTQRAREKVSQILRSLSIPKIRGDARRLDLQAKKEPSQIEETPAKGIEATQWEKLGSISNMVDDVTFMWFVSTRASSSPFSSNGVSVYGFGDQGGFDPDDPDKTDDEKGARSRAELAKREMERTLSLNPKTVTAVVEVLFRQEKKEERLKEDEVQSIIDQAGLDNEGAHLVRSVSSIHADPYEGQKLPPGAEDRSVCLYRNQEDRVNRWKAFQGLPAIDKLHYMGGSIQRISDLVGAGQSNKEVDEEAAYFALWEAQRDGADKAPGQGVDEKKHTSGNTSFAEDVAFMWNVAHRVNNGKVSPAAGFKYGASGEDQWRSDERGMKVWNEFMKHKGLWEAQAPLDYVLRCQERIGFRYGEKVIDAVLDRWNLNPESKKFVKDVASAHAGISSMEGNEENFKKRWEQFSALSSKEKASHLGGATLRITKNVDEFIQRRKQELSGRGGGGSRGSAQARGGDKPLKRGASEKSRMETFIGDLKFSLTGK
jgi:hypothetical protein